MEKKKIWIILTVVALAFLFVGAVSAAENETNTNENTIVDSYYDDYDNYDDYYDYDNYDEYEEYDYYDEYDEFYEDWNAAEHAWVDAKSTTFQEGQSNNYVVYPSTGSYAIKNSKVTIYLSGNTYTGKYFYKTYKKWSNNNGEAWFSFKNLPAGKYNADITIEGYYGKAFYFAEKNGIKINVKPMKSKYFKITGKPSSMTSFGDGCQKVISQNSAIHGGTLLNGKKYQLQLYNRYSWMPCYKLKKVITYWKKGGKILQKLFNKKNGFYKYTIKNKIGKYKLVGIRAYYYKI